MPVLLVADCAQARARMDAVVPSLLARLADLVPELEVRRLDLDDGPRVDRLRLALGFGWHARDWTRRATREAGQEVFATLESCGCGRHHLMGLGRTGIPAVRWSLVDPADARAAFLDRLAAKEGAVTFVPTPDRASPGHAGPHCLDVARDDDVARVIADAFHAAKRPGTAHADPRTASG